MAQQKAAFFAHHKKAMSDDFLKEVMRRCGPERLHSGRTPTEEDYERWLTVFKRNEYLGPLIMLPYLRQRYVEGRESRDEVTLTHSFTQSPFEEAGKVVHLLPLLREPQNWFSLVANPRLNPSVLEDAKWFAHQAEKIIPLLEPDFAFLAQLEDAVKTMEGNPTRSVWPTVIYGPVWVERLGRQRLLQAPAQKIEQLSYGGILLQVSDNPLTASIQERKALEDFLTVG